MRKFERRIIQIGSKELECNFDENPDDGFHTWLDAVGDPAVKHAQKFYPANFQGISGEQFPDSVWFSIYNLKRGFRFIDSIVVKKLNGKCTLVNSMSIDFQFWDLEESLGSFIDRYADALRNSPLGVKVETEKTEYGYYLTSTIPVAPGDGIYSRLIKLEELQESTYRKQLVPVKSHASNRYGEERIHWWIRYVIVPLLGSSAVAAVLGAYLFR